MSKTLFETLFGPFSFSDGLFNYRKSIAAFGNEEPEVSDDKYAFKFHLGGEVDLDCLKVSMKDNMLKISYEKDSDNGYARYNFARTLPEDADLETVKAQTEGKLLTITVERKPQVEDATKVRSIPIDYED